MKFSELDPEQQAASRQRTADALERADRVLDEMARREVPEALWQPPTPEPQPAPQVQPAPKPRAALVPPEASKVTIPTHDPATGRVVAVHSFEGATLSTGLMWEKWVRAEIDRRVGAAVKKWVGDQLEVFAKGVAEVEHEVMTEERLAMRRWVDERIAAALEERAKQAEARAGGGPRLVGGASDAA